MVETPVEVEARPGARRPTGRPVNASRVAASLAAILITATPAAAFDNYPDILAGIYSALVTNQTGVNTPTSTNPNGRDCSTCHTATSGGGRTAFGSALDARISSSSSDAVVSAQIQNVGENGFVPATASGQSFVIPSSGGSALSVAYSAGTNQNGTAYAVNQLSSFVLGGTDASQFSINTSGQLVPSSGQTPGATLSVNVTAQNPLGFRPVTAGNAPAISVRVNRPPVAPALTEATNPDDNAGTYSYTLLSGTPTPPSDPDGDTLTVPTVTLTSVTDENSNADATYLGLSFTANASSGLLSFSTAQFDALNMGESRTLVFTYTVSDGVETASNIFTVTVDGAREPGNAPPVVSTRTITVTEDTATPVQTDLTQDDGGTTFTDPDGDPLSVASGSLIATSGSGLPVSLTGDIFAITDLSPYQSLAVGESRSFAFTYDIDDTQVLTQNDIQITVNGVNDPVTASDFSTNVDESLLITRVDLAAGSGASDVDASDVLVFQNLRNLTSSPALRDPAKAFLTNSGSGPNTVFEFVPEFTTDLNVGESVDLTFTVDVTDQNGSTVPVNVTITVDGVDSSSHGAQAGLYANSLAQRYPLAAFQDATTRPAACFTCHTPATNLNAPKPNCNSTTDFTEFGRELCLDNRGGSIGQRLSNREAKYAPRVTEANIRRFISESAAPGTAIQAPISVDPGLKVDGTASQIHSFYIEDDFGGTFTIDPDGQVRLARAAAANTYQLMVTPRNISGSKTAAGAERNVAGFYPRNAGLTMVEIVVSAALPSTVADAANASAGTAQVIDVLANDTGGAATSVTVAGAPANGTAVVNGDLTISYTANTGFSGTDSFTYTSTNATGTSSAATVTVTVVSAGGLAAQNDTAATVTGRAVTIDVLANDTNAGVGTVVTIPTPPATAVGTATVSGQDIVFTPATGFSGTASLAYQATNPGSGGSSATVTVAVSAFGAGTISSGVTDPELIEVARALEVSCGTVATGGATDADSTAFLAACNALTAAAGSENIDGAMRALRNEEHFASVDAAQTIARGLGRSMSQRLGTLRRGGGGGGVDVSGIALRFGEDTLPSAALQDLFDQASERRAFGAGGRSPWGGYVSGEITLGSRDGGSRGEDADLTVGSLSAGVDYEISPGRVVGFGLGYARSETDFAGGGSLSSDGFQLSLYGVERDFLRPGLSLQGYASVGQISFDSDRRINFTNGGASVDAMADASFEGRYINLAPRLTLERRPGPGQYLTLGGYIGLDYLLLQIDDYTESGGAGLALAVDGETYQSLVATLGVELSQPVLIGQGWMLTGFGGAALNAELLDRTRSVTSSFAVAGPGAPTFTVTEDGTSAVSADIELGTQLQTGRADVELSYSGSFSFGEGLDTHSLSATASTPVFGPDRFSLGLGATRSGSGPGEWNARAEYGLKF